MAAQLALMARNGNASFAAYAGASIMENAAELLTCGFAVREVPWDLRHANWAAVPVGEGGLETGARAPAGGRGSRLDGSGGWFSNRWSRGAC